MDSLSAQPVLRRVRSTQNDRELIGCAREALLVCMLCREPTQHSYNGTRRVGIYGNYEQVYDCIKCGMQRRYGLI